MSDEVVRSLCDKYTWIGEETLREIARDVSTLERSTEELSEEIRYLADLLLRTVRDYPTVHGKDLERLQKIARGSQ